MAHEYRATIAWKRQDGEDFSKGRYSRAHEIRFDGGITIVGSSSPSVGPLPFSRDMMTFIDLARRAGLVINSYEDEAVGIMERIAPQRMAITKVTLRPKIAYGSAPPDKAKLDELHHQAHELCFIANSVKTEITIEARS